MFGGLLPAVSYVLCNGLIAVRCVVAGALKTLTEQGGNVLILILTLMKQFHTLACNVVFILKTENIPDH